MTKKLLYLMAGVVVVLLQAPAFAQNPKPPNYCKPCLFYGGDFGDASVANGLANEQDLIDSNAQVWVPFDVPKAQQWKVTGLFTNDLSSVSVLDPQKAVWSIATGVGHGKCGKTLVSGNSAATFKPTGRNAFGLNEYTTLTKIKTVPLQQGRYWLATVPECTNRNDSNCGSARYLATEFTGKPLDPFGPPEPCNLSNFTTDEKTCKAGVVKGCLRTSAGVLGTKNAGSMLLDQDGR